MSDYGERSEVREEETKELEAVGVSDDGPAVDVSDGGASSFTAQEVRAIPQEETKELEEVDASDDGPSAEVSAGGATSSPDQVDRVGTSAICTARSSVATAMGTSTCSASSA